MIQIFNYVSNYLLRNSLFFPCPFSFLIGCISDEPPLYHLKSFFLSNSLLYTSARKDYSYQYYTPIKARLMLFLTTWNAKIQVNLTTKTVPEARGRILTAQSRVPGAGVDLLKGNSSFDKISEQFMSLYPCSLPFLLCRNVN